MRKSRAPEHTAWVFNSIRDRITSGAMSPKELAHRTLVGDGGGGGRGLVDLYLMKFEMRKYALTTLLDRLELPTEVKEGFNKVMRTHKAYRKNLCPITADDPADLSWRRGWKRASIIFLSFIEDFVFNDTYDSYLRTAARSSKSPADVMEYEVFKTKWQEVHQLRQKEQEEERKAELPAEAQTDVAETTGPDAGAGGTKEGNTAGGGVVECGDRLEQEALRTVNANITLKIEPESQVELKQALISSSVGHLFGVEHKTSAPCFSPAHAFEFASMLSFTRCQSFICIVQMLLDLLRYVLVVYDVKQASEPETYPSTRTPPLKPHRFKKVVAAVVDARRTAAGYSSLQMVGGDMYMIFDGKRSGNAPKLKSPFTTESADGNPTPMQFSRQQLHVVYQEKGITDKKAVNRRGTAAVKQNEQVHCFTRVRPRMPTRSRRHFEGTTLGDTIGHVPAEDESKQWSLTVAKKRDLYDKYRVPVGGRDGSDAETDPDEDEEVAPEPSPNKALPLATSPGHHNNELLVIAWGLAICQRMIRKLSKTCAVDFDLSFVLVSFKHCLPCQKRKKNLDDVEPVFFNTLPKVLIEELMHLSGAAAVIDLTAGSGGWALACLEQGIPYFGVVLTEIHLSELHSHLAREAFGSIVFHDMFKFMYESSCLVHGPCFTDSSY